MLLKINEKLSARRRLMLRRGIRGLSAGIVAAMIGAGLSGCIAFENSGPIEVSVVDGRLAVAFCTAQTIDKLNIAQVVPGQDRHKPWTELAKNTAQIKVDVNQIVVLGQDLPGLKSYPDQVVTVGGTTYDFDVELAPPGIGYGPTITVPAGGLTEGEWVGTSGVASKKVCEGYY